MTRTQAWQGRKRRPLGKEGRLMLFCCCGVVVVLLWCFGDSFLFLVSLYNIYWIIKWYSLFPCKQGWPPRPRCSSDVVMLLFPALQLNLNHGNREKRIYVNRWMSHCTWHLVTHWCSEPWPSLPRRQGCLDSVGGGEGERGGAELATWQADQRAHTKVSPRESSRAWWPSGRPVGARDHELWGQVQVSLWDPGRAQERDDK